MSDYISREAVMELHPKNIEIINSSAYIELDELLDLVDGIPAADVEPANRWIPCSERLPEKAGFYLVATPRGIEIMEFSSGDKRYRETPYFVSEALGKVSGYVTHWQPLPEPPEEGDAGNAAD